MAAELIDWKKVKVGKSITYWQWLSTSLFHLDIFSENFFTDCQPSLCLLCADY